ncbi:DNAJ protein JJJ1 homolog [Selaginella moellendorffii]|uniref:DNAJ protein JJJ1 homolog n=1 Tax=Selaginella moellendorffii TaxID=88036 RepID=UPI000D1C2DEC|nr:DNAJ protein JJJ1 homolog [Selaginella moellendorffii]|eukprot:XP_002990347.2 DNAJ protein JJJ1 homolog [Selaginella moellendorffii]
MERKQCLYEVLGVERSASAEEIRSAYRREALRWHPDKIQQSGISAGEATERFQAISSAWEVLGDPLERKWYDSHRSEILSSGDELSEFEFNLWSYFSPSAFSGYGDSRNGFYAVYSEVFGKISVQEQVFDRKFGSGSVREAPPFGGPTSSHSEVSAFYSFWSGFKTVKDYAWCDEYDVSEAPNRKVRRLMEEENRKIRKREQREFNDAVRQLAAFVKKRDKRVMEWKLEALRLAEEKEKEKKLRRQQQEVEKLKKVESYEEQEWSKVEEDYSVWEENQKAGRGGERQEFYCILCEKNFKSEKQWHNHEKSKKHIERASALKETLLEEDEKVRAKAQSVDEEEEHDEPVVAEPKVVEVIEAETPPQSPGADTSSESNADDDEESSILEAMLNSHRNRGNTDRAIESDESDSIVVDEVPVQNKDEWSKRKATSGKEAESEANAEEKDVANVMEELNSGETQQEAKSTKKKNRRKEKGKKPVEQKEVRKSGKSKAAAAVPSSTCEVCGRDFDSRNLLFKHVESSKHFALKQK